MSFFVWFKKNKEIGIFLLRLFIGVRLIYGVLDNILHWNRMIEFRDFLFQFNFPFPLVCAIVSVYAQFFAGIMIILGWKIRYAALLMIINFLIALLMVHRNQEFEQMTVPLAMLFCNVLFLFQGSGKIAIEKEG